MGKVKSNQMNLIVYQTGNTTTQKIIQVAFVYSFLIYTVSN